ncbi:MAG: hypothetical protein SGPRY_008163 [Prymnesium sp.]
MASMGAYAHTPLSEPRAPPSTLTRIAALLTVRSHARLQSSYPLADAILALLEASGVAVDDKRRAWHLQSAQPVTRPPPLPSDAPRCAFCSAAFPSRNALFKHLRDPRSRCSRLTEERDGANPPARADDGGGISLAKGEGEKPWIKVMARRPRRGRPYAIVAFRDAEEAERVRAAMDGVWVGGESCASSQLVEGGGGGGGGFELKLRPLPRPALLERLHRLGHRGGEEGKVQREEAGLGVREASTSELRARLALALSMPDARRVVRLSGHAIPPTLAKELLTTLSRSGYHLRWPARSHRRDLSSEHYLVLKTSDPSRKRPDGEEASQVSDYADLRELCAAVMAFAEPGFQYSGIAVTHNFEGR